MDRVVHAAIGRQLAQILIIVWISSVRSLQAAEFDVNQRSPKKKINEGAAWSSVNHPALFLVCYKPSVELWIIGCWFNLFWYEEYT